jgi:hypothetical protein
MCYSEFNDIIASIADMDADVITIETSRSDMELLDAFENFQYPNEIGPGVYDIHSPNIPTVQQIVSLMERQRSAFLPSASGSTRTAASRHASGPKSFLHCRTWWPRLGNCARRRSHSWRCRRTQQRKQLTTST